MTSSFMRDLARPQILAADVLGVQRRERRTVAGSRPGTKAAIACLRASSVDTLSFFLIVSITSSSARVQGSAIPPRYELIELHS
jgi:hypothetical protein